MKRKILLLHVARIASRGRLPSYLTGNSRASSVESTFRLKPEAYLYSSESENAEYLVHGAII